MAKNKITLATLAAQMEKGFAAADKKVDALAHIVENGFAAVADDMNKLATKDDVAAVHEQVNSIETQLRDMKHTKLQSRVADLEDEVFGESRAKPSRSKPHLDTTQGA